ncbi:MAG: acetylglutamate kinase [Clostridiaceae bacterium]
MNSLNIFENQTFVIKYGGSIMKNLSAQEKFIEDIKKLQEANVNIVIVHGGGPEISTWLDKMGMENRFYKGLRVTNEETMQVVEMVLSGNVNKNLAANLTNHGVNAIGISGRDCNLVKVEKQYAYDDENNKVDIGYVGEVKNVNTEVLTSLAKSKLVPVISPIGTDDTGHSYNINADYVASYVAGALNADRLIIMTDIDGVYRDINYPASIFPKLTIPEINGYIKDGIIAGGMIPKMQCCIKAIEMGTKSIQLLDGRVEHTLINSLFSFNGTQIISGGNF